MKGDEKKKLTGKGRSAKASDFDEIRSTIVKLEQMHAKSSEEQAKAFGILQEMLGKLKHLEKTFEKKSEKGSEKGFYWKLFFLIVVATFLSLSLFTFYYDNFGNIYWEVFPMEICKKYP